MTTKTDRAQTVAQEIVRRWLAPPDWTRDGSPPGWNGVHDAIVEAIRAETARCATLADERALHLELTSKRLDHAGKLEHWNRIQEAQHIGRAIRKGTGT